jgi:hypothetical protein
VSRIEEGGQCNRIAAILIARPSIWCFLHPTVSSDPGIVVRGQRHDLANGRADKLLLISMPAIKSIEVVPTVDVVD